MPRTTNAPASRRRRKSRLKLAKGYYGNRSKTFRMATESVDRAMVMSYAHRKQKKGEYRGLWIVRLAAACKEAGMKNYSQFMDGVTKAGIKLNRKMLSEIAIHDPQGFARIVEMAKAKLAR